jgi:hypothetical protein
VFKPPQKTAVFLFVLLEIHIYFSEATLWACPERIWRSTLPFFSHFIGLFNAYHFLGIKESRNQEEQAIAK